MCDSFTCNYEFNIESSFSLEGDSVNTGALYGVSMSFEWLLYDVAGVLAGRWNPTNIESLSASETRIFLEEPIPQNLNAGQYSIFIETTYWAPQDKVIGLTDGLPVICRILR